MVKTRTKDLREQMKIKGSLRNLNQRCLVVGLESVGQRGSLMSLDECISFVI